MLRLGRPVGAYPGMEARLAAIHLGRRKDGEVREEGEATGCKECGGKSTPEEEACSNKGDTTDDDSDCECVTGKEFEKNHWYDPSYE